MSRPPAMRFPVLKILFALSAAASGVALLACGMETLDAGSVGAPLVDGAPTVLGDAAPFALTREEATRLCEDNDAAEVAWMRACTGDARPRPQGMMLQCIEMLLAPGITADTVAQLQRCITTNRAAKCGDGTFEFDCLPNLTGSLPLGARCVTGAQCASGLCTGSHVYAPTCGTCGTPLKAGSSCQPTSDECEPGYVCEAPCQDDGCEKQATCVPYEAPPVQGPSCGADAGCATGLGCDAGACVPLAAQNEPCTTNADCLEALRCDPAAHVCIVPPTVAPGENCNDPSWSEQKPCPGSLYVCPHLDDGTDRCHIWIPEGKPCGPYETPGSLERCDLGLRCIEGRCRVDWPVCR